MSETNTMKKYININTKFRPYLKGNQSKNTDFIITLPNSIRNVESMRLKSFNAPDAEYTFSVDETNNSFEIINQADEKFMITITPGKYSGDDGVTSLINEVNSQLAIHGLEMEYIRHLNRYIFTGGNIRNYEINFDVQNNYIYNTFGWTMGFQHSYYSRKDEYAYTFPKNECNKNTGLVNGRAVVPLPGLNEIEGYLADSPTVLPNTSLYYMLYVDDFLNNVEDGFYEGCFPSNNNMKNVLAKIATKYALDNNTYYLSDTDSCFQRVYSGPVTLNKLAIKLFNDNNQIVDFNNKDYTFLLELVVRV